MHNTDMLFVYVSVSMEDKDSVYMYEEASHSSHIISDWQSGTLAEAAVQIPHVAGEKIRPFIQCEQTSGYSTAQERIEWEELVTSISFHKDAQHVFKCGNH